MAVQFDFKAIEEANVLIAQINIICKKENIELSKKINPASGKRQQFIVNIAPEDLRKIHEKIGPRLLAEKKIAANDNKPNPM